jgi:hypothetical protein
MIAAAAFRCTLIAHRYLGIAFGALMVAWCLSGAVMLYVPYPRLTEDERVRHLAPIPWQSCCAISPGALANRAPIEAFQLEMLASEPILRVRFGDGSSKSINLSSGLPLELMPLTTIASAAQPYAGSGSRSVVSSPSLVQYDQWTVQGAHGSDRPLYRFALNDSSSTEVYVSSRDGRVVQVTTARIRFWNWLGAVPHWIYFPALRAHPAAWTQTIVWTSAMGCLLTLTGLIVGIAQFRRSPAERWIPYRGFHYWHHALGLVFGVFVLSWIFSGLLSMNPWGLLEGSGFEEPRRLAGRGMSASEVSDCVQSFTHPGGEVVSIEAAPLSGVLYLVATRSDGTRVRLDQHGVVQPLANADLDFITQAIDPGVGGYRIEQLNREDAYFFSHNDYRAELPVLRVTTPHAAGSRYYLDPVGAGIRAKLDWDGRQYRWWHQALHRWDFSVTLRSHPLRDVLTLVLLGGVTAVCGIGTYVGLRGRQR